MYFIVIPVFNSEKTLNKCINSVPQRDDIQIVVSYDESNDNSWTILRQLSMRRSDIEIVKCQKQTAGATRNVALKEIYSRELQAQDRIIFLDSDDFFDKNINTLLNRNDNSGLSIYAHNTDQLNFDKTELAKQEFIERAIGVLSSDFKGITYRFNSVWGKVFSAVILKKNAMLFDENIKVAEDLVFLLNLTKYIDSVSIVQCNMYYYMNNPSSLTHRFYTDFLENDLQVQKKCRNLIPQQYRTVLVLHGIMNIFGLQIFSAKTPYNFNEKKIILKKIKTIDIYKYTFIDLLKNLSFFKKSQVFILILFKVRFYGLMHIVYLIKNR